MKKLATGTLSLVCTFICFGTEINIDDFYSSKEIINGVQYPREQKLETLVNKENSSLKNIIKTLINDEKSYLSSPMLKYIELALKSKRYRFYDDIYSEIKSLDMRSQISNLKTTLTSRSNIKKEALLLLEKSVDLSDSQGIKTNYLAQKNEKSSYIVLKPSGSLTPDKYNSVVGFEKVNNTIDVDYYDIKTTSSDSDFGIIKFFKVNWKYATHVDFTINKTKYRIEKYSDSILEIKSNDNIINYICSSSCPVMLKSQLDLDLTTPNKLVELIYDLNLKTFVKENKYKDLSNQELLVKLQNEETYSIIQTLSSPTKQNLSNLEYKFKEISLNPREALYFEIPERYSKMSISGVTIGHRQSERKSKTVDPNPGYTAVAVYTKDLSHDKAWRYWGGHASGPQGAKFAEQRRRAEIDTLYEWPRLGHKSVKDKSKSSLIIKANSIRVRNVGRDEIKISSVSLKTIFSEKMKYDDYIFSDGSNFGNPNTFKNRFYNGGQIKRGTFPNSLVLHRRSRTPRTSNFPSNWTYDSERVFIPIKNMNLATIEVMAGDTHPDMIKNKDGGWGTLGNAKLSVGIADNTDPDYDKEVEWLAYDNNIGPQGVTPISVDKIKNVKNKFLILRNKRKSSPLYIMGIRIGHQIISKEK